MKTIAELEQELESARGGGNYGDVESAAYALAEARTLARCQRQIEAADAENARLRLADGNASNPLTIADVLRRIGPAYASCHLPLMMQWDGDRRQWLIIADGTSTFESPNALAARQIVFATADEAAACAEFLRLTEGK